MNEKLITINLVDELPNTFKDVEKQLRSDELRYGNTWKEHGLVFNDQSQETRFFNKIREYEFNYIENGTPVPWDKIIGEAHICKVREKKLS